MNLPSEIDTCSYCRRTEIAISNDTIGAVELDDAPPVGYCIVSACHDCRTIIIHAIRVGALALRNDLASRKQLDLFEGPKDRVIRQLNFLEGTDAPSE